MKGMGGGMQQLMRQANQMQNRMKKVQEELASQEFEGSSGGGAVLVKVNSDSIIQSITIQPEVLEGGDKEMLQDMIMVATNDAIQKAKDILQKEMDKVTDGFSMPGIF